MQRLAEGSGPWSRTVITVIVAHEPLPPHAVRNRLAEDTVVVATPLDLIVKLEDDRYEISTVVLSGDSPGQRELATFLLDTYPSVRVVDDGESGPVFPAYA